jgi:preprotein translocase subunit YajC
LVFKDCAELKEGRRGLWKRVAGGADFGGDGGKLWACVSRGGRDESPLHFPELHIFAMHKMILSLDLPSILAQATAQPAPGLGDMLKGMWPFLLLMAAMWFLMIAPQRKKQKEHAKMLAAIKSGDDILTSGGIYGTVVSVKEDRFVVRLGDSTKVELAKGFVQSVEKKSDSDKKSD